METVELAEACILPGLNLGLIRAIRGIRGRQFDGTKEITEVRDLKIGSASLIRAENAMSGVVCWQPKQRWT